MEGLLSKEDCQIIIKNAIKTDGISMESYKIIPFKDENSGLLSDYFRLKINYREVKRVVIKITDIDNEKVSDSRSA